MIVWLLIGMIGSKLEMFHGWFLFLYVLSGAWEFLKWTIACMKIGMDD